MWWEMYVSQAVIDKVKRASNVRQMVNHLDFNHTLVSKKVSGNATCRVPTLPLLGGNCQLWCGA